MSFLTTRDKHTRVDFAINTPADPLKPTFWYGFGSGLSTSCQHASERAQNTMVLLGSFSHPFGLKGALTLKRSKATPCQWHVRSGVPPGPAAVFNLLEG